MNAYDKLRGAMGFPIDAEVGAALAKHYTNKLKVIYEASKCYVVKLQCTGDGKTGFFNGFFYSDSYCILTSGHILGFNGADKYTAVFSKGTPLEVTHELELLHVGSLSATISATTYQSKCSRQTWRCFGAHLCHHTHQGHLPRWCPRGTRCA